MNYKNETLRTLQKFPIEYSLGDVIFSALQKIAVKNGQSLNFLREVSDEDLYTATEKSLNSITEVDSEITELELINWVNSK